MVVNSYYLILISIFMIVIFESWKVSFIFWINILCVVFLAPTVLTIRSRTFQHLLHISFRSETYFKFFIIFYCVKIDHWCK